MSEQHSKHDDAFPVVILGSGLAGLIAAAHLAERGLAPLILETDIDWAGGRLSGGEAEQVEYNGKTWSFPSEHGVHAVWGAYDNMRAALDRFAPVKFFPSTGEEWINKWGGDVRYIEAGKAVRATLIPAPFHYLQLLFNWRFWRTITPLDFLSLPGFLLSIIWTISFDPIREGKPMRGLSIKEYFRGWTPNLRATFTGIAHSMLAANSEAISLTSFIAAIRFYTMLGRDRWTVDYFPANSDEAIIQPLLRHIRDKGGDIHFGADVQSLQRDGEVWRISFEDKKRAGRRQVTAVHVISALHPPGAKRLFLNSPDTREAAAEIEFPNGLAGAVVRIWFSRAPKDRPSGGMFTGDFTMDNFFWLHIIHREFQAWHQDTGGSAIEVHMYGPNDALNLDDRTLIIQMVHEVGQAFPELKGAFVHASVRRNSANQTQFIVPDEKSLHVETPWEGIFACGDWIGHPAPVLWMERCCVTGIEAANRIIAANRLDPYPLIPTRPPERIVRVLGGLFYGLRKVFGPPILWVARLVVRRG